MPEALDLLMRRRDVVFSTLVVGTCPVVLAVRFLRHRPLGLQMTLFTIFGAMVTLSTGLSHLPALQVACDLLTGLRTVFVMATFAVLFVPVRRPAAP